MFWENINPYGFKKERKQAFGPGCVRTVCGMEYPCFNEILVERSFPRRCPDCLDSEVVGCRT